jgi:perosamine synthetase
VSAIIPLSDPDLTWAEVRAVEAALQLTRLSGGILVERFEEAFAASVGRAHSVAVSGSLLGMQMVLRLHGIGAGDEVICSSHSWKETAHAVVAAGAVPVFSEIDYWSGTLDAAKIEMRITPRTKAILASNTNGHPAPWGPLEALALEHGLLLLEDSTEAIGSRYQGRPVGSFGHCSVFDFSHPSAITCGEGGMVVTDDELFATRMRRLRGRRGDERSSVVAGMFPPLGAQMSDVAAALGFVQLERLEQILLHRQTVDRLFFKHIKSFEGIKDPYIAPEVDCVHWMLYVVHMGTRFTRSSRDAIVEDLRTSGVEAAAYCHPLHTQRFYVDQGHRRGELPITEKVADRAVALPLHKNISEEQIAFIVSTMKDASINVGAGAAIY